LFELPTAMAVVSTVLHSVIITVVI